MKAKSSCWTCKSRKIGCDKNIPCCNNCSRTERKCLGYGFRLVWPDRPDGRRRTTEAASHVPAFRSRPKNYGEHFLTFDFEDMDLAIANSSGRDLLARLTGRPRCSLTLHAPILGQDSLLLSYYENVISPMVSTTQARNGFSTEILPMALSREDACSSALCNALLAISAFHHLGREAALPYKLSALRRLSNSLSVRLSSPDAIDAELAACMMLCMYSVFDEEDGSWHVHLNGARKMLHTIRLSDTRPVPSDFLVTWFLYYDVLGHFTQPFQTTYSESEFLWLQTSKSDASLIVGSLGCSVEIFDIIHQINRIRGSHIGGQDDIPTDELVQGRNRLETRLHNLVQRLDPDEEQTASLRRIDAFATADLYRLATILYLQRVCPMDGDNSMGIIYIGQAFHALRTLEVVTSPWPLFIIACESRSEEQQITILEILDQMDHVRSVGNVTVMRRIIEMFWKQNDLRADTHFGHKLDWWHLVNSDVAVPWFA
ncbi:fungal-specific transcription factor domain-containing protein [Ilyonectria sp. MPI-CAGE-AT-0026]|nr:fungal-specific transcription factor domain-containing protein [Ilyonectria sp. MPI-CAGE-AT-0026]